MQVDLVNNMLERARMLKNSGGKSDLPQVHVNNWVSFMGFFWLSAVCLYLIILAFNY